jgi:hypothetical protein
MSRAARFWIFLAASAFLHFYASANDKVWVGLSKADPRDWDDGENWLPPGAPSGGDRVYIGVSPHSGTYTVNIKQSIDLAELALVRSALHGAVLVNVNGGFSSEGGSLSGGLQAVLKSGGAAKRGSGGEFALGLYGAQVENQGTFAISTNGTLGFSQQPSTFINKGIVELSGGAAISFFSAGDSLFDNRGTLRNASDGTIASIENAFLNNAGTIIAQSGTLRFTLSRVTNNSTIKAEGSATNLFTGGTLFSNGGSKLDGSGWHRVVGADWLADGNSSALLAEFSGGSRVLSLAAGSELDCNGQFRWLGGTIASVANAGRLSISGGSVEISGSDTKTLDGAVIDNAGDSVWTGTGTILVKNGGIFLNDGSFRIENNSDFAGSGIFQNEGLVQKNNTDRNAFTTFSADFNNNKSVLVSQGNLGLSGGTSRGSFIVREGAELQFFARRHTVQGKGASGDGANFSGDGFTVISETATLDVRGSVAAENVWLAGDGIAQIQLAGELNVSGKFNWSAGTISGVSNTNRNVLTIMAGGLGSIQGANKKTLDNGSFVNESTTTWRDAGDLFLVNGARLENDPGRSFVIYNDAKILGGGKESLFHNSGKLSKSSSLSGPAATTVIGAGVRFEHGADLLASPLNCSLQVFRGSLRLEGGGAIGGSTTIEAGGTLEFRQGNYTIRQYGIVRGDGWALVTGGTLIYFLSISPFTTQTLPVAIDNLELTSGSVQGAPNDFGIASELTVKKSFRWTGGRIGVQDARTRTVFTSETETLLTGPDQKRIDQADVELLGQGTWDGAGPLVLANNARVYLGSSLGDAAFDCLGDFAVLRDGSGGEIFSSPRAVWHLKPAKTGRIDVDIENSGELVFENGAYTLRKLTIRKGQVDLKGPQLKIANGLEVTGGALSGSGTVDGPVQNNGGEIKPGHSPGHLVINGDFRQNGVGRTILQIGGNDPAERDLLEISGNGSLDGTIRLELLNNFIPKAGDRFEVMRFAARSGTFPVQEETFIGSNLIMVPEYSATNVVLVAQAVQTQSAIMAIASSGELVNLSWPSVPTTAYQLETSINLDRWTVLSNFPAGALSPAFSVKPSEPQRFYRLR